MSSQFHDVHTERMIPQLNGGYGRLLCNLGGPLATANFGSVSENVLYMSTMNSEASTMIANLKNGPCKHCKTQVDTDLVATMCFFS